MVHTLPDWTTNYKLTNIFSSIDTAELAARLGSGVLYDRRGNIVDYDDFEHGSLKWGVSFIGHAGSAAVSTDTARSGGKSLKVTTAGTIGDSTTLLRAVSPTFNVNIGLELSFASVTQTYRLWIFLQQWKQPAQMSACIRYTKDSHLLEYLDNTATFQTIDNSAYIYESINAFYPIKLVVDMVTGTWKRVLFLDNCYDLDGFPLVSGAGINTRAIVAMIYVETREALPKIVYLDDIIITQNEP